jgi:hypothetical protein
MLLRRASGGVLRRSGDRGAVDGGGRASPGGRFSAKVAWLRLQRRVMVAR